MQNQNNTNPMETGSIPKLLAQLAIPAVVAQIINLLYNIVDRIYIGHIPGIGAAALTGVGLFAPILMLLNAFAMLVLFEGQYESVPAVHRALQLQWERKTMIRQKKSSVTVLLC